MLKQRLLGFQAGCLFALAGLCCLCLGTYANAGSIPGGGGISGIGSGSLDLGTPGTASPLTGTNNNDSALVNFTPSYAVHSANGFALNFPDYMAPSSLSPLLPKGRFVIDYAAKALITNPPPLTPFVLNLGGTINIDDLAPGLTAQLSITGGIQNAAGSFLPNTPEVTVSALLPLPGQTIPATSSSTITITGFGGTTAFYAYEDVQITIINPTNGPLPIASFVLDPPSFTETATAIPEPSTLVLGGIGLALLPGYYWRRKKNSA